jgi:hypothetical protein
MRRERESQSRALLQTTRRRAGTVTHGDGSMAERDVPRDAVVMLRMLGRRPRGDMMFGTGHRPILRKVNLQISSGVVVPSPCRMAALARGAAGE